jgi:hypothetical protein
LQNSTLNKPYQDKLTTAAALFGLVALTFLLNQSALSGGWRFDDGWLLDYASRFSPLDYFFHPAITRGYSLNNLTPVNPLIFDLNLHLFGFNPQGFYIQHLSTLAGCGIATYFLLRIQAAPLISFLGAALFLAGAPTLFVAQQLMVGHYIAGLLFTIIAIYTYRLNLTRKQGSLTILSTLCYIMATTCKEIYFPLPFVLLFLGQNSLASRIYMTLPMFTWSMGYLLWRFAVLGSFVGGYDTGGRPFSLPEALQTYSTLPELLLPGLFLPWLSVLAISALALYLAINSRVNIALLVVALLAVMLPLAPLTQLPGITQANRYLLLPWWLFAVALTSMLAQLPKLHIGVKSTILLTFITASGSQAWQVQEALLPKAVRFDAVYDFFLNSPANRVFYSDAIKDAYYLDTVLNGARFAQARFSNEAIEKLGIFVSARSQPSIIAAEKSLWAYNPKCHCVEEITNNIERSELPNAKPPKVIIVPISAPYPPLFKAGAGSLKLTRLNRTGLRLSGVSTHPPSDLEHEAVLVTPVRPDRIKAALEQAGTKQSNDYRFHITLNFEDREDADIAAAQSCLLIRSAHTPLRLLPDQSKPACRGLLSPEP